MKKIFYLLLFVLFIFACKEKTSESTEPETSTMTENVETSDSSAVETATIDTTDQKIDELQNEIDEILNDL